jgi:hypothetical protein
MSQNEVGQLTISDFYNMIKQMPLEAKAFVLLGGGFLSLAFIFIRKEKKQYVRKSIEGPRLCPA